jgi:hypothetical protein
MIETTATITIRQAGGGYREITLTRADYETYIRDRAMIDCLNAIRIVEVARDGKRSVVKC